MSFEIDLSSYKSIHSALFVRIPVDYYKEDADAEPSEEILRFSDYPLPVTLNSEVYQGLGKLVSIGTSSNELRVSSNEVTVSISGIPNSSIYEIINSKIKGCSVTIYRVLFDAQTGQQLNIPGNPLGRFRGFINNYSLNEDFDVDSRTSTNTLILICASQIDVMDQKIAGRKTNPSSMKKFYPSDESMDRVPNLVGAVFDFGVPK